MSYASSKHIDRADIPVIDISSLDARDPAAARTVADAMREAALNVGFFYVSGHGVDAEVIENANRESRNFFTRPLDEKLATCVNAHHRGFLRVGEAQMYGARKIDLKESFIWGIEDADVDGAVANEDEFLGHNQWPFDQPQFQSALVAFFNEASGVARNLMRAFALSMDLPEASFIKTSGRPISRGASVYYPPQDPTMGESQFGVAPHTDYGCLTLVWQDDVGGLEVRANDGEWLTAHPIEDTFVVNVGDLLTRWTNGNFKSTPHRVVNRSGRERCSMALFWDPDSNTVIDPALSALPDESLKYPVTTVGEYILKRFGESFAYRSKV